ncbi:MAG: hypothetical protein CML24_02085 [Rhizobiales bacterium]|nr:hypothetical protein [Hyphomicrobiales bacterium]
MSGTTPQHKMPKLIVAWAFEYDDEGELRPAFEPREMQSEDRAVQAAKIMATQYAGAISWSREAKPDIGEYGDSVELFRYGDVPDLD